MKKVANGYPLQRSTFMYIGKAVEQGTYTHVVGSA